MIAITKCVTESDFCRARKITTDYIAWLNMDLSFQDIDREFAEFPAMYGPPQGFFFLAWHAEELAGGVGLRMITAEIAEMKRLFVYDHFRSKGIGQKLCNVLIEEAKRLGYKTIRLDTLDRMQAALGLYKSLGFQEIGAYRFNPDPTARYMELCLK